jgi:endonuclease YncB( thermonuclease family)
MAAAIVLFAVGLAAGAGFGPLLSRGAAFLTAARLHLTAHHNTAVRPFAPRQTSPMFDQGQVYPAELLRVVDGDTFEARVRVWPGLNVETKVRLRGIDAPELHARCASEYAKAEAARRALADILAQGGIALAQVGLDKYAGRVDAAVATRGTADVSAALLNGGFARSYGGGRRRGWC